MFDLARYDPRSGSASAGDERLSGADYEKYVLQLKRIGNDCGIVCNQSHAPFPSRAKGMEKYIMRAIECTALAGGKICIVHPDNDKSAEENAEFYARLLPLAKDCGVKIAAENMWNWNAAEDHAAPAACSSAQDFLRHEEAADDEYLVACLDIGHAEMRGLGTSAEEMIAVLGKKLQALHIHDNDKWHDSHALPYTMQIDFAGIAAALKKAGYEGDFTLEADTYLRRFDGDNVLSGLENMRRACERFYEDFNR